MHSHKKTCITRITPVSTWNKKHSSKQVVRIIYKHEKRFSDTAAVESFEDL